MGQTKGFISWHGEDINLFPWRFTEPARETTDAASPGKLKIVGYTPIVHNAAFAAMTLDDARWMARLIGQLTTEQIVQALKVSGYDESSVQLYTKKLISRRNHMISDLELGNEYPPLAVPTASAK